MTHETYSPDNMENCSWLVKRLHILVRNRVLAACGHKNLWPATVQAPVSFFLIILSSLLARSSGTHSRLMIQLWCVYQMSLWASVKQSICSFVAFNEVDFDFMDVFQSRSVRTDFADIGILTDFVVDNGLCFLLVQGCCAVLSISLHLLDNNMLT